MPRYVAANGDFQSMHRLKTPAPLTAGDVGIDTCGGRRLLNNPQMEGGKYIYPLYEFMFIITQNALAEGSVFYDTAGGQHAAVCDDGSVPADLVEPTDGGSLTD